MSIANEPIFVWLSQFAFQPGIVYTAIVTMMLLSAVGLPIPEEVTLLSTGLLAFMGSNPQLFPPPYVGAPVVNATDAAIIAAIAVFAADFLIYSIGRFWGRKLFSNPRFSHLFPEHMLHKAEEFTKKYGSFATGIFRFTPGIRFPGHLLCGMLKLSAVRFAFIDGIAVMISVPTQILLMARYGEPILIYLKKFKLILLIVIVIALVVFGGTKLLNWWRSRKQTAKN